MQITGSIKYCIYYTMINQAMNVEFLTSLQIENDVFKFLSSYDSKNAKFTNFFYTGIIKILLNRPIDKYL